MAREFVARKGLIISGSTLASGSITATNFTGSLFGTSSWAVSASWAPGGGVTINNNTNDYLVTATGTANTLNGESGFTFDGSIATITYNGSYAAGLLVQNTNATAGVGAGSITIRQGASGGINISATTTGCYFYDVNNTQTTITMAANGVGILNTNPGVALDVTGTIRATGNVIAYYSSDKQLKDNITPIPNALEKVKQIGGYEFDWNDKQTDFEGHDIGVIAQEIEAVLPEIVVDKLDGYKGVDYHKLSAVLIEAIKEL